MEMFDELNKTAMKRAYNKFIKVLVKLKTQPKAYNLNSNKVIKSNFRTTKFTCTQVGILHTQGT